MYEISFFIFDLARLRIEFECEYVYINVMILFKLLTSLLYLGFEVLFH